MRNPGRPLRDERCTSVGHVNPLRTEEFVQPRLHHRHVDHATGGQAQRHRSCGIALAIQQALNTRNSLLHQVSDDAFEVVARQREVERSVVQAAEERRHEDVDVAAAAQVDLGLLALMHQPRTRFCVNLDIVRQLPRGTCPPLNLVAQLFIEEVAADLVGPIVAHLHQQIRQPAGTG